MVALTHDSMPRDDGHPRRMGQRGVVCLTETGWESRGPPAAPMGFPEPEGPAAGLAGRVIAAQEAERARVARDLHDEVGQDLTSVLLGLRLVETALSADPPDSARALERTGEVRNLVAVALRDVRNMAYALRPAVLDDVGLLPALERLLIEVSGASLPVELLGRDALGAQRLDPNVETVVYRVVQEALTNVVRHAHATRATVALSRAGARLRAVVTDDGVGFSTTEEALRSVGLAGMSERAGLVRGRLSLRSRRGEGTVVTLEVPVA
jgi:two-component system, NarL family, sensor histidine kinase DevS